MSDLQNVLLLVDGERIPLEHDRATNCWTGELDQEFVNVGVQASVELWTEHGRVRPEQTEQASMYVGRIREGLLVEALPAILSFYRGYSARSLAADNPWGDDLPVFRSTDEVLPTLESFQVQSFDGVVSGLRTSLALYFSWMSAGALQIGLNEQGALTTVQQDL